jgi:hypothetical protein
MRRVLLALAVVLAPATAWGAIARDGGASYPVAASNTGTINTISTGNLTTSTASTLVVCTVGVANGNGAVQSISSVAWASANGSCSSFARQDYHVVYSAGDVYDAGVWTSTCSSTFSGIAVTATAANSAALTSMGISCDALTGTGGVGQRLDGAWSATLANSVVVPSVTAGSWVYVAAANETISAMTPVANTTEIIDTASSYPVDVGIGVNTTGTSGDITVGWSTTVSYGVKAAVEILASGNAGYSATIAASADDAMQSGTTMTLNGTTIGASLDATTEWIGMRFLNVTIPKDATITTARLAVVPSASTEDEPLVTVYAQAADDCSTFTSTASDITNRSRTTGVSWSSTDLAANGATYHAAPSLVSDVQAVINRASWASGNDLCVLIQGGATTTRDLTVEAFDATVKNPATLTIVYATSSDATSTLASVGGNGSAGNVSATSEPTATLAGVGGVGAAGTVSATGGSGSVAATLVGVSGVGAATPLASVTTAATRTLNGIGGDGQARAPASVTASGTKTLVGVGGDGQARAPASVTATGTSTLAGQGGAGAATPLASVTATGTATLAGVGAAGAAGAASSTGASAGTISGVGGVGAAGTVSVAAGTLVTLSGVGGVGGSGALSTTSTGSSTLTGTGGAGAVGAVSSSASGSGTLASVGGVGVAGALSAVGEAVGGAEATLASLGGVGAVGLLAYAVDASATLTSASGSAGGAAPSSARARRVGMCLFPGRCD